MSRRRILVVEDNPATRALYRETLGDVYELVEAGDLATARRALDGSRFDLVLLDLVLPDGSGREFAAELRARPDLGDLPVIAVTGFLSPGVPEARADFDELLLKPVAPDHLREEVRAHLPRTSPRRPSRSQEPGRGRTVLVVDDEESSRRLLRLSLEGAGFLTRGAASAAEALDELQRDRPDLLVTDVIMPELDGFGLCMGVREDPALQGLPVVLVSNHYGDERDQELARAVGGHALVPDARSNDELPRICAEALESPVPEPTDADPGTLRDLHVRTALEQLRRQARLTQETLRRSAIERAQLELVSGVTRVLARRDRDERVFDHLLADCLDSAGISRGALLRLGEGRFQPQGQVGLGSPERLSEAFREGTWLRRRVLEDSTLAQVSSRDSASTGVPELLEAFGDDEVRVAPLSFLGSCHGVLVVGSRRSELGHPPARRFLEMLATHLAQALALIDAFEARDVTEERFRVLAENLDVVLWIVDVASLRVTYVSPGFRSIWGRDPATAVGSSVEVWASWLHPEDRDRVVEGYLERARQGPWEIHYRVLRPDGSEASLSDRGFPIRDESGELVRLVGIAQDLTEKRALESRVHQAQRLESVGRLAGGIAHDFNNILTVISGCAELGLDGLRPDDPLAQDLERIRSAAQRGSELTDQLLAFGRRQVHRPRRLDLGTAVTEIHDMLSRLLGEDVALGAEISEDLWPVRIDPGQLSQVLINLALNARDAMPRGGSLRITVRNRRLEALASPSPTAPDLPPGDYVLLEVTDSGEGMDEATRIQVFEPFFTTKPEGKGTGLGLSSVFGIVKQSHGDVTVESTPGEGSSFRIFLPRGRPEDSSSPPPTRTPEPSAEPRGPRGTILLVEDDDDLRFISQRSLERRGHSVLPVASPGEALIEAERLGGEFDMVVTDVVMPGMTGVELVRRLEETHGPLRTLYMSGYSADDRLEDELLEERVDFLQKPFRPRELQERVREALVRNDSGE